MFDTFMHSVKMFSFWVPRVLTNYHKAQITTIYKHPVPHFEKSELSLEVYLRIQAP
jgi:hypothetical protein